MGGSKDWKRERTSEDSEDVIACRNLDEVIASRVARRHGSSAKKNPTPIQGTTIFTRNLHDRHDRQRGRRLAGDDAGLEQQLYQLLEYAEVEYDPLLEVEAAVERDSVLPSRKEQ